jgi:hypothetical protein
MNVKKATLVRLRLVLLVIGILGAVTGLPFGFSKGQINLMPIPGLTYANPLSGIMIGALGILIAVAEAMELYFEYEKNFKNPITNLQRQNIH